MVFGKHIKSCSMATNGQLFTKIPMTMPKHVTSVKEKVEFLKSMSFRCMSSRCMSSRCISSRCMSSRCMISLLTPLWLLSYLMYEVSTSWGCLSVCMGISTSWLLWTMFQNKWKRLCFLTTKVRLSQHPSKGTSFRGLSLLRRS